MEYGLRLSLVAPEMKPLHCHLSITDSFARALARGEPEALEAAEWHLHLMLKDLTKGIKLESEPESKKQQGEK